MQSLLQGLREAYPNQNDNALYAAVLSGEVTVNGQRERSPARRLRRGDQLCWQRPFASRGGYKLQHALQQWRLPVAGRVLLDAGASTGGFSDCLLRHGAGFVYAVDCGQGQLLQRLRRDPRVAAYEQTPIQKFQCCGARPDWAVADLSFRSLRGVLRHLLMLTNEAWGVVLCKPQFEWQDAGPDFHGVVPLAYHQHILRRCRQEFLREGVCIDATLPSPIPGRYGNQEYLLLVRVQGTARQHGLKTSPLSAC